MRINVYQDGVEIGTTGDLSRIPEFMQIVELHPADARFASKLLGREVKPGTYTPAAGDVYSVAMAATFKGGRLAVELIR